MNYSNLFNSIYVNYTKNSIWIERELAWSKNSNYDLQSDAILWFNKLLFLEVFYGGTFFELKNLKDTWIRITHNEQQQKIIMSISIKNSNNNRSKPVLEEIF